MAPVLPGMKAGWPRGTAPITSDNKDVKNPSLTLNRQVNLYPLTNYTFGTKGKKIEPKQNPVISSSLEFYYFVTAAKRWARISPVQSLVIENLLVYLKFH